MGWVLPSPIRNRVGYGLKKKTQSKFGFYKKKNLKPNPKLGPNKNSIPWNYKNTPYIYTYNLTLIPHFFSSNSELPPPSLSPHPHSDTPSPSAQSLISAHTVNQSLRNSLNGWRRVWRLTRSTSSRSWSKFTQTSVSLARPWGSWTASSTISSRSSLRRLPDWLATTRSQPLLLERSKPRFTWSC